jgi:hypothetical protein
MLVSRTCGEEIGIETPDIREGISRLHAEVADELGGVSERHHRGAHTEFMTSGFDSRGSQCAMV